MAGREDRDIGDGAASQDSYLTVRAGEMVEIKIKGSRFLGVASPASSLADAMARVGACRRAHHKATHHCWALRAGTPECPLEQSDDDGEPTGTAGIPILSAIRGADLLDLVVVVTRYFGGTKLGKGGLVRAYREAARAALERAPRRTVWRERQLCVTCSWDDVGHVEAVLARHPDDVRHVERDFSEAPRLVLRVLDSRAEAILEAMRDATAGRAEVIFVAG